MNIKQEAEFLGKAVIRMDGRADTLAEIIACLEIDLEKLERENLGLRQQTKECEWIPFTDDEDGVLNCTLPDDEQELLISNGRVVWIDTFMSDGEECWLDNVNADLIGLAWQPLPEPYRKQVKQ